jgi:uracil DNA glycosylase
MMPMSLANSLPGAANPIKDDVFLPITREVLNILNKKSEVVFFIFIGECIKHQSLINRHKHGVLCFQTTSQMIASDYLSTIDKFIPGIEWGMVGGTELNIYDRLSIEH